MNNTPLRFLLLVLIVLAVYAPAYRSCGFIWDDDSYVEDNVTLRTLGGLRAIWCRPGATMQYYPMVYTTFWVEYHVWGLRPAGYHFINALLHGLNSGLLWLLLRRLNVPGAWFAAAIFAVHPVHVESVAWVTERKNVLSAFFCLLSFLACLRFAPPELPAGSRLHWRWYAVSLGLFTAALLSKTITCSLPAVLVLVYWWKRGEAENESGEPSRVSGRVRSAGFSPQRCGLKPALRTHNPAAYAARLAVPLLPFLCLGAFLARQTSYLEKYLVGADGDDWNFSLLERCLIAGRALCFYAGKLFWPHPLIFNYPRWHIDAAEPWQYLYFAGVVLFLGVLAFLTFSRRLDRGPLTACLIFAGTLLPALGFFNVYPMLFSFVADHFQYLPSAALIALTAATAVHLGGIRLSGRGGKCLAGCLLLLLGWLACKQCEIYKDRETIWLDTLQDGKNPNSWLAATNMGDRWGRTLDRANNSQEVEFAAQQALRYYDRSIALNPRQSAVYLNRASVYHRQGRDRKAQSDLAEALKIEDGLPLARRDAGKYEHMANLQQDLGNNGQALTYLLKVCDILEARRERYRSMPLGPDPERDPGFGVIQYRVGELLTKLGRGQEAPPYFDRALANFQLAIDDAKIAGNESGEEEADAQFRMGFALLKLGRSEEAIPHLQRAVQLQPGNLSYQDRLREARSKTRP